ncbi:MAG: hypothetical protein IKA26_06000 [Alistipes sp.]|nr:hypothetical protein [Alistipes sp.]
MKKIFGLMLLCATIMSFSSCEQAVEEPQIVDVCFGVKFVESGSMSRATVDEIYQEFYNKHIVTKEFVLTTYDLTISDEKGNRVAVIDGTWDKTTIQLLTGKYKVTGTSTSSGYSKASLKFEETITISTSETINLTAKYDCFLLLFPRNNDTYKYSYDGGYNNSGYMPTVDDLAYMFIRGTAPDVYYTGTSSDRVNLDLTSYKDIFQIGCYYYFNIVTGTFNIPPMENGGI